MIADNDGPAFPFNSGGEYHPSVDGMTLRDYFAAKAMPMALDYWRRVGCDKDSQPQPDFNIEWSSDCEEIASLSYFMADAMLKAREA